MYSAAVMRVVVVIGHMESSRRVPEIRPRYEARFWPIRMWLPDGSRKAQSMTP